MRARLKMSLWWGAGCFLEPRSCCGRLLPRASITIVDSNAAHLAIARRWLDSSVTLVHDRFDGDAPDRVGLVVIPLSFAGDRRSVYGHPPARNRRRPRLDLVARSRTRRSHRLVVAAQEAHPDRKASPDWPGACRAHPARELSDTADPAVAPHARAGSRQRTDRRERALDRRSRPSDSIWLLPAVLWHDVAVGVAFWAIDSLLRRPRLMWLPYAFIVGYVAINVPIARVLSSPLTVPMWRATRRPAIRLDRDVPHARESRADHGGARRRCLHAEPGDTTAGRGPPYSCGARRDRARHRSFCPPAGRYDGPAPECDHGARRDVVSASRRASWRRRLADEPICRARRRRSDALSRRDGWPQRRHRHIGIDRGAVPGQLRRQGRPDAEFHRARAAVTPLRACVRRLSGEYQGTVCVAVLALARIRRAGRGTRAGALRPAAAPARRRRLPDGALSRRPVQLPRDERATGAAGISTRSRMPAPSAAT